MTNINNIIEEICNDLLAGKIVEGLAVEAIILTGSFVHGEIHEQSDVDIFVVVQKNIEYIRHIAFYRKQKLIQLRVCPYNIFVDNCLRHERKRPAAYACKVLHDNSGKCTKAIAESKKFLDVGPKKMGLQLQEKLKNTIKNEMKTLEGLIASKKYLSAYFLINDLICMNIDYYNNINGYWMTNNNYLFSELKDHNTEIYYLVNGIIFDNEINAKVKNLKKLCNLVIKNYDELTGEYVYDEVI